MVHGKPLQIVEVCEDGELRFHRELLDIVIAQCGDVPVAVYTVAGEFRKGKTTILNIFLAFNCYQDQNRCWQTDEDSELAGFEARGGSLKVTNGIWVWSEPLFSTSKRGERLAIVLMDTQGTFDQDTSSDVNSFLFGFSLCVSSILMFNLMNRISHHDVDSLVTFGSIYMPFVGKFQKLCLLVRDWNDEERFHFGWEGGQKMVEDLVNPKEGVDKQVAEARLSINHLFEKVSGFLLPPPGLNVVNSKKRTIKIGDLGYLFKELVDQLCEEIFVKNVQPFKQRGKNLTADQWARIFDHLVEAYKKGKVLDPGFHKEASAACSVKSIKDAVFATYQKDMSETLNTKMNDLKSSFLAEKFLLDTNSMFTRRAINQFKSNTKHYGRQDAVEDQLTQEMAKWFDDRKRENNFHFQVHAELEEIQAARNAEIQSIKMNERQARSQFEEAQRRISEARRAGKEVARVARERYERKERELNTKLQEENLRVNEFLFQQSEQSRSHAAKLQQKINNQKVLISAIAGETEVPVARGVNRFIEHKLLRAMRSSNPEFNGTLFRRFEQARQETAKQEQLINHQKNGLALQAQGVVIRQLEGCVMC